MSVEQEHSAGRWALVSRLRRALPGTGQLLGAAVATTLWLGLASPSLQLLPGIGELADESIEISLQSAILGIDDGSGRPAEERARAAAAVLGLAYDQRLLAISARPAGNGGGSGVVELSAFAAALAAEPEPPAVEAGTTATPVAHAVTPAAEAPPAPAAAPVAPPAAPLAPAPVAPAAAPEPARPTPTPSAPRPSRPEEPPALLRAQSVSFATTPPAAAAVGGTYDVVATASSGLPVRLSIGAGRTACKLAGSTVSFRAAGTCVVEAHQGGNDRYAQADARQSFEIGRAAQTISFTSSSPDAAVVGGSYTVSASASSGLAVVLSVPPPSRHVCELAGTTVTFARAGTCTVEADQPGDASFLPAATAQQSFAVAKQERDVLLSQTVSFTTSPPAPALVGGSYAVAAVASSGLPVGLSVSSASAGVCALGGTTVSLLGAGTCTVLADQPGGAPYEAAPQQQQSFAVVRASQSTSFTSSPPGSAVYGDPDYTVAATASSGLPVSFSIAPASASVCSLAGSTVSIVGAGTCTVLADQAGNGAWSPAPQVQQSFAIGQASQTITITSANPSPVDRRSAPYTITATASSGLPVSFSLDPSSSDNCDLVGATLTFARWGDCIVYADQAGDADYRPAPQAQQIVVVVPNV